MDGVPGVPGSLRTVIPSISVLLEYVEASEQASSLTSCGIMCSISTIIHRENSNKNHYVMLKSEKV